jgi:hypothetical protein
MTMGNVEQVDSSSDTTDIYLEGVRSNLSMDTDSPVRSLSWFSLVPLDKFRDNAPDEEASVASSYIFSKSLFTNRPTIQCCRNEIFKIPSN